MRCFICIRFTSLLLFQNYIYLLYLTIFDAFLNDNINEQWQAATGDFFAKLCQACEETTPSSSSYIGGLSRANMDFDVHPRGKKNEHSTFASSSSSSFFSSLKIMLRLIFSSCIITIYFKIISFTMPTEIG